MESTKENISQNITNSKDQSKLTKDKFELSDDIVKNTPIDSDLDEESEESDDGIDIDFPRDSAQDLLQFLHRELNNLQNMEDAQKRKFALIKFYQIFVSAKHKAPNKIY